VTIAAQRPAFLQRSFCGGFAPHKLLIRFIRGNKTQITLTISPALLDRVDEVVRRKEISRAALLTLWIGDGLAKEQRDHREAA
jgi:hypothetical protein